MADMQFHKNLLYTAHKDAQIIINDDPNLQTSRGASLRVLLYLFEQDIAFLTYKA
jgi:ATP-dependent DNA helicase RecG